MLDKAKMALRVKTNTFDVEIQGLIDACIADLKLAGIRLPLPVGDDSPPDNNPPADDPLIMRAVALYCKAQFGFDAENSERYVKAYDALKLSLALAGDYRALE